MKEKEAGMTAGRMEEPDEVANELSHRVIGAAIEVHRILGPGFRESVYEEALVIELTARGIPFQRQHNFLVGYKGHDVGKGRIDLLVGGCLVVELKCSDRLLGLHRAQVISYLKATGCSLGLLLNFKAALMRDGIERIVYSR